VAALTAAAHRRHSVREEEDVGALRRAVARMTARLPGMRPGEAELAATELATNLLRHATTGGYVLFRPAGEGIELLAVDHGPGMRPSDQPYRGMHDAARGNPDQPSRGLPGLGVGLAGVKRRATTFDSYSTPRGTVVLARFGAPAPTASGRWRWGAVNVGLGGDGDSGDGWAVTAGPHLAAVVVDGLGHGTAASAASRAALSVFNERPVADPGEFVRQAHEAMRATRGGVLGVCVIVPERDELIYAGVGNVVGRVLLGREGHGLVNREGTLGTQLPAPRPRVAGYRWAPGATLVLTSDGIRGHWDMSSYPGLLAHDPAVIAAVLHRDNERTTDDATVLVVRDSGSGVV
jgi:anti-sigma regulatory factor (Ser/Thr protein kinase)